MMLRQPCYQKLTSRKLEKSRGRIPNATQKMASKFHIGPKYVYEIWDDKEHLQQGVVPEGVVISSSSGQPVLDENSQTDKIEQTESNIHGQNTSPFAELEKKIRDAKVELGPLNTNIFYIVNPV
jgi:hypothetical protein